MSQQDYSSQTSAQNGTHGDISLRARTFMGLTGYVMILTSMFLFCVPLYQGLIRNQHPQPDPIQGEGLAWLMQYYDLEFFSFFGAIFITFMGFRLLDAAGKTTPRVIPVEDRALLEPLINSANKEAIEQYVILSSLTGFTGTFQKIGFSGLPLATVVLTLFFCMLSFFKPEFIEFAKLTLGAFIGSFVQRKTDASNVP